MSRLLDSMKSISQLPSEDLSSNSSIRDFMEERSKKKEPSDDFSSVDEYDIPVSGLVDSSEASVLDDVDADIIFDSFMDSDADLELQNNLISLGRKYAHEGGSKEASNLHAQFIPQESALKKMISDLDRDISAVGKDIDNMRVSRSRNPKAMSDLIAAQSSLYSTKLSAIKEQTNIKKIVADLQLKIDGKNASQDDAALTASMAIQQIFSGGTDVVPVNIDNDDITSSNDASVTDDERIHAIFGDSEETDGDIYLKYEGRNVRTYCQINEETGEKRLVAKDDEGNELPDYPLPNHADELIFTVHDDLGTVSDNLGRDYLLEYV